MANSPGDTPRSRFHARLGGHGPPGFTLVELLVAVAVLSLMATMLLPSLAKAKNLARTAVCTSNLRQHGVAMNSYANDFNGRFPLFGGSFLTDIYGRYRNNWCPWAVSDAPVFFRQYLVKPKLAFCPTVDWTRRGLYSFINPVVYMPDNPNTVTTVTTPAYLYLTGRKMHNSTWANHDTTLVRNDPNEILATDVLEKATQDEDHTASFGTMVSTLVPWFNPHYDRSCQTAPMGQAKQVLASGAVVRVTFVWSSMTIPYYSLSYGQSNIVGPPTSFDNGPYFAWDGR